MSKQLVAFFAANLLAWNLLASISAAAPAAAPRPAKATPVSAASYGAELEEFAYPYPVKKFEFESQQQKLHMAYLDVAASGPANGRSVVLLHGKNFCAATWESAIAALTGAGFRVVAPDQVGFCKSS
jgi:hypothetical protein